MLSCSPCVARLCIAYLQQGRLIPNCSKVLMPLPECCPRQASAIQHHPRLWGKAKLLDSPRNPAPSCAHACQHDTNNVKQVFLMVSETGQCFGKILAEPPRKCKRGLTPRRGQHVVPAAAFWQLPSLRCSAASGRWTAGLPQFLSSTSTHLLSSPSASAHAMSVMSCSCM